MLYFTPTDPPPEQATLCLIVLWKNVSGSYVCLTTGRWVCLRATTGQAGLLRGAACEAPERTGRFPRSADGRDAGFLSARDEDDYVALAVRLGTDKAFRAACRRDILRANADPATTLYGRRREAVGAWAGVLRGVRHGGFGEVVVLLPRRL